MKIKLTCLLFFVSFTFFAQEEQKEYSFSLEEAIEYAIDSSYNAINARRDIEAAIKRKWETTADGLPQIDANIDYQNNLKRPVQLLPAEITGGPPGTFIPVQFGTKQNLSATATATQLLFDGSYLVALRASKTFLDYTNTTTQKTLLEVRKSVIDAYGNVLLAQELVTILESNQTTLQKNYDETKEIFENGLQEEEAVEQLQITLLQITNQLNNAKRLVGITQEMLNLTLGIPLTHKITLTEDLDNLAEENISLTLMNTEGSIEENLDYKLAQNLIEQREHEPATYNWYDSNGDLVYSGEQLTVTSPIAQEYKLEIIANSDGHKDYAMVNSESPYTLESLSPNPANNDQVQVNYKAEGAVSGYISITSTQTAVSNNYILNANDPNLSIDVSTYSPGTYVVALICDGEIIETKNLIIQ